MVKTSVVLVEEHDSVEHGAILVHSIIPAMRLKVKDSFGNEHEIEKYIVMTERTMYALLDVLKQTQVAAVVESFLPEPVNKIEVLNA